MDIRDFQRIAKAVGMEPTERKDIMAIASPDGDDAYVIQLIAVTDGPRVDAVWLSLRRGPRRVLRRRVWSAADGWSEIVAGGDAVDRLARLVNELHGWAEAERTAWAHARSVSRLLDGRVGDLMA